MKKFILTLVLMLTALAAGAQTFTVDGLTYKVTKENAVIVTSYSVYYGESFHRDVRIPSTITYEQTTYNVIAIGDEAFNGKLITSISIPASVESVGNSAFNFNDSLKTVRIEDGDTPITLNDYYYATFDNSGAKYTVYVGRNIERMYNKWASPYPQATSITWGPQVTAIGNGEGRSPFLKKAVIGNSVKSIGAEAFYEAGNASESDELMITMGVNVESIGGKAFYNCSKLTSIELPKVLKDIPDYCFNGTHIRDIVIPASVMSVGNAAFNINDSIKTVVIEDSDVSITFNDYEYYNFDNSGARYTVYQGRNIERVYNKWASPYPQATSITWGPQVTAIGNGEGRSPFLKKAVIGNSVKSIGAEAFYEAGNASESDELMITMGVNVESIGGKAFYNCSKLTSIELPKVLKDIPDYCFNGTHIRDIVIPASVMSVGNAAFNINDSIKTVVIEDSDVSITFNDYEYYNFDNSGARYTVYQGRNIERMYNSSSPFPQAESVAFGTQVTSLGSGMYDCANIKYIIAPWGTPISINSDVFNSALYGTATLYVPRNYVDAYKAADVWKDFFKIEEMEETKCFTPTATLEDGRLHFECETKDVTFHYKYTYPEGREGTGNDVSVGQTIYLTLYATKVGLEDSDNAYYELEISGGGSIIGIKGDVNEDGVVNGTDIQEVINIIVNAE